MRRGAIGQLWLVTFRLPVLLPLMPMTKLPSISAATTLAVNTRCPLSRRTKLQAATKSSYLVDKAAASFFLGWQSPSSSPLFFVIEHHQLLPRVSCIIFPFFLARIAVAFLALFCCFLLLMPPLLLLLLIYFRRCCCFNRALLLLLWWTSGEAPFTILKLNSSWLRQK